MSKGIAIDPTLRDEILRAIHDEGLSAYKAGQVFGVNPSTIRNWLAGETKGLEKNYICEINLLKKKLDNAYRVIGRLTAEVQRPKD